jgi:hypothetical protein
MNQNVRRRPSARRLAIRMQVRPPATDLMLSGDPTSNEVSSAETARRSAASHRQADGSILLFGYASYLILRHGEDVGLVGVQQQVLVYR